MILCAAANVHVCCMWYFVFMCVCLFVHVSDTCAQWLFVSVCISLCVREPMHLCALLSSPS